MPPKNLIDLATIPQTRVMGLNKSGQEVRQTFDHAGTTALGGPTVPGLNGKSEPHEGRIYTPEEYYHPDFNPDAEGVEDAEVAA